MSRINIRGLKQDIKACTICAKHLPHEPNPVVQFSRTSKLIIVGQAPGLAVHKSGVPWNDKSGDRLRAWLELDKKTFYDPAKIAHIPTAFCYPGRGKSGDLPPRKACAPQWHKTIFDLLPDDRLIVLVGGYAVAFHLSDRKSTLTETLKHYNDYLPKYLVLPHPSPRNNIWLKKNPWFEEEQIPIYQNLVGEYLD